MTAPTTITDTGTFYNQDGTLAGGTVVFQPADPNFENNSNTIMQEPITATLSSGVLSQVLVNATGSNGYNVQEKITGAITPASYTIAGTSSIDLSSV